MNEKNDDTKSTIYQLDLSVLCEEIKKKHISDVVVYGIGRNSKKIVSVLKNLKIKILFYIDKLAEQHTIMYDGNVVRSPRDFVESRGPEAVILTPITFEEIKEYLIESGISKDNIIIPYIPCRKIKYISHDKIGNLFGALSFCESMVSNPEVTVCTIAYNTPEGMFRRTIESVLNQTYRNFIYVLIVNGATDSTEEIVKEYANRDKRIKLFHVPDNLLWTDWKLLQIVADNIYGRYWTELDSDDYLDERYLEKTIGAMDESDADVVGVQSVRFFLTDIPMNSNRRKNIPRAAFINRYMPGYLYGHQEIMTSYAEDRIHPSIWGKLFSADIIRDYFKYLQRLDEITRNVSFRLDVGQLYKMLFYCRKMVNIEQPLHFVINRQGNSSNSQAPIEWLTSIWYVYKGLMKDFWIWDGKGAVLHGEKFLEGTIGFCVKRESMIDTLSSSPNKSRILEEIELMKTDEIIQKIRSTHKGEEPYDKFFNRLFGGM